MRKLTKAIALILSMALLLTFPVGASAADHGDPTEDVIIHEDWKGSLTIYKYDLSSAERDGVWDSSYVSTGRYDEEGVNNVLGGTNQSDLGNGEVSYGYAIKGVEFSYLRVADIVQFSESTADNDTADHVEVLYGIDKTKGADFLKALGLENGAERYTNADQLDATKYYYQSDVLIDALAAKLEANSTTVKDALETYIAANGGTAMPLTDSYGKTVATDLDLGLYLLAETKVPEMVVSTTDPFLVSVPMTTVNGTNAEDGGERWFYNITLYPKNLTGIPSLEKTLRENVSDTGKNNGSASDITDGYAHTGTASDGDVIDYQVISTLPSITSESTYLTVYTFIDTLSKGLTYNKNDIVLEFFKDAACTDLITTWKEADGKFTATYNTTTAGESVMTIEMTERGLFEINTSRNVYTASNMVNSGYSGCTLRITYKATMNCDDSVVYGDGGNPNDVVLTWKRSSTDYYDTLVDDNHVYTYGIDLTKLFSDGKGDFANVEFIVQNSTDAYYVVAELDADDGVYYVTGFTRNPDAATHFVPVKSGENSGKVVIKGLEDDLYIVITQFGGDIYTHEKGKLLSMPTGISDFWKAFIPLSGSDDTPDVEQANISGNQLGSWHAAFIIPLKKAEIKIYGEHMFEDFSQLFFFEYQSDKKGKRNVIYYPWKDFLAGIRITNKSDIIPFLSAIQYEYLTTRDQSGALYHDPSNYFNEQMDGADNYYNHGIYPGWHHWGMGIGNPLVISPSYNGNGNLQFRSNRLIAHNIGINGTLKSIPISYRFNYTYSENWGTYGNPLSQKKYTTSILGDFIYAPPFSKWLGKISIGYDNSNYIGNNSGITFTLSRVGEIFNKK